MNMHEREKPLPEPMMEDPEPEVVEERPRTLATNWREVYEDCLANGFDETESMELLKIYIAALYGGTVGLT